MPVVFFNKKPSQAALDSYDKAYYVGADAKQSGIMQGDVIADAWKKHPSWDKDKNGVINYVLIKGEMGHPDAEARTKFVIDELHKESAILVSQERYDEALGVFNQILEIDPDNVKALNHKGATLVKMEEFEHSLEYFDKALELQPNNTKILKNKHGDSSGVRGAAWLWD